MNQKQYQQQKQLKKKEVRWQKENEENIKDWKLKGGINTHTKGGINTTIKTGLYT
jgi:hypothetical protein